MELPGQIRKYRREQNLSQEELAERVFVTRQSVSNWENGKTYPDLNSLLRLSALFGISLDILIKGDLEEMKKHICQEDQQRLSRDSTIYAVLLFAMVVLAVPLLILLPLWAGIPLWLSAAIPAFYFAFRIERQKKALDIHTYREIVAFSQGEQLDEIEKARESGKRPYQAVLAAVLSAIIAAAVCALMFALLT